MVDELPQMNLKPIGTVRNGLHEPPHSRNAWGEAVSDIIIDSSLNEALDGLEEFSHLIVLFWMHRLPGREMPLKQRPMGRPGAPLKGLFALRTPNRPNPIGKSTVRLLERQGNVLTVQGLDALDGSPVIDIKPYLPGYDVAVNASVPAWITN